MDTNTRRPRRVTIFRRAGWLAVAAMVATGLFAAPGAVLGHTPSASLDCASGLVVNLQSYVTSTGHPKDNTVDIWVDGAEQAGYPTTFGNSFTVTIPMASAYVVHTAKVVVVAWDNPSNTSWSRTFDLTLGACATPNKAFVCKYVGTPGVNERLQTGNNPIDVAFSAIKITPVVAGAWFADGQWRSYVLAIDVGQPEPPVAACPQQTRIPGIHIVKTPSTTSLPAGGGSVTYTYTVTNTGNVPLNNVTVADDKCSPAAYVSGDTNSNETLDLTETWTFSCTTSLTATTTNTAIATGHYGETGSVTDQDQATVTVSPPQVCTVNCNPPVILTPALTVTKFVGLSQSGPFNRHSVTTAVGTTVWYRVTMTNNGQEALSGVTFSDSLGLPISCSTVPTTLNIGDSYSCTYSRTATLGTTDNTATGTSSQVGPKSDTATVIGTGGGVEGATATPGHGVGGATGKPHITPPPTSALGSVPAQPAGDTWRIALLGLAALLASLLIFSPKTSPERRRR